MAAGMTDLYEEKSKDTCHLSIQVREKGMGPRRGTHDTQEELPTKKMTFLMGEDT